MAAHANSTPAPDRRHLLSGALALGAAALTPQAVTQADAALLEIERRLDEIQPELERRRAIQSERILSAQMAWEAAGRPMGAPGAHAPGLIEIEEAHGVYAADCDYDELAWQVTYLTDRAAELPAQSLDGLRVKARIAVMYWSPTPDDEELRDLMSDLIRLTGAAEGRPWMARDFARVQL